MYGYEGRVISHTSYMARIFFPLLDYTNYIILDDLIVEEPSAKTLERYLEKIIEQ